MESCVVIEHAMNILAVDAKHLAARRQNRRIWTGSYERLRQPRSPFNQVLAVIQHEQEFSCSDFPRNGFERQSHPRGSSFLAIRSGSSEQPRKSFPFAPVLSSGLKDPSAAQFKWMPVILTERDGITDYCGLVNGKNSYGGDTGFVHFYAHLTKNEKGRFVKAALHAVEPANRETNFIDPRWLNGICEQFGYDDFSLAK
jgi:hypothetical protein